MASSGSNRRVCARIAGAWQTRLSLGVTIVTFGKGRGEVETVEFEQPAVSVVLVGHGHLTENER